MSVAVLARIVQNRRRRNEQLGSKTARRALFFWVSKLSPANNWLLLVFGLLVLVLMEELEQLLVLGLGLGTVGLERESSSVSIH